MVESCPCKDDYHIVLNNHKYGPYEQQRYKNHYQYKFFQTLSMERILIVASAFPVGEKKTAPILSVELG